MKWELELGNRKVRYEFSKRFEQLNVILQSARLVIRTKNFNCRVQENNCHLKLRVCNADVQEPRPTNNSQPRLFTIFHGLELNHPLWGNSEFASAMKRRIMGNLRLGIPFKVANEPRA